MNRSFTELKRIARETLNGRYSTPVFGLITVSILAWILIIPFIYLLYNTPLQSVIYYFADFVIQLISIVLSMGLIYLHFNMRRKKAYSLKDIFYYVSHHPDRFILAYLLLILFVFISLLPGILLSIPAFIFSKTIFYVIMGIGLFIFFIFALIIRFQYTLVFYLMIDYPDMPVKKAFSTSRSLMKGYKMRFFLLNLSFIGWFCLGVLSLFIGFLWISPYYQQTLIGFYEDRSSSLKPSLSKGVPQDPPSFEAYC